jgi:microcystin degradation protein MlrC
MIRIATAGFLHESNTFSSIPASLPLWQRSGILDGDAIRKEYAQAQSTLSGFLALEQEDPGVQVVPLVFSRLTPMGAITEEAVEHLMQRIVDAIRDNGPWDGVLLPQHGAAVSVPFLDPDGELLRRVRELVGPDVPIGMALDMHANVSPAMVEPADVVTVYQTNPHIDARAQALLCARMNGSTSPSSTDWTLPVSNRVRSSFTNWYGCMVYVRIWFPNATSRFSPASATSSASRS